ncbi:MAG: glycosyltransferase family 2 protein [Desulfosalsimonadaceae bacterium]
MECLLVIPAWNESASIQAVVDSIKAKYPLDVLVVDDGSSDNTGGLAEKAGADVVRLAMNMGAWTATQTGFRYALSKGYKIAVTMDADGQHFAESIPLLIQHLNDFGADVVIGSNPERASKNRQLSWAFFRWLTSIDLQDFTSGMKAYNRQAMKLLLSSRAHLFDYQDLGALLLMRRAGLTIRETPVPMQKRLHGHSRIFSNWWRVLRYMTLSTVLCISKYRH